MSANKIANTQSRAARTISIVLLTILAFTGIAFVSGATSFKLGLDLYPCRVKLDEELLI